MATLEVELGLEELRAKKKAYVSEQADKIVAEMVRRNVISDTLATCDAPNWDRELHRSMLDIAKELQSRNIRVTSSVKFGVTDWVFSL
jgi:hypothetical protein